MSAKGAAGRTFDCHVRYPQNTGQRNNLTRALSILTEGEAATPLTLSSLLQYPEGEK